MGMMIIVTLHNVVMLVVFINVCKHLGHWLWTQMIVVITDPHFASYSTYSISARSLKSIFKIFITQHLHCYSSTLSYHDLTLKFQNLLIILSVSFSHPFYVT